MAEAVYILCALTALACATLLVRSYARTRVRLLLWSSLCFAGLALNNVLLVIDLVLASDVDLQLARNLVALGALSLLLLGLIWESH